MRSSDLDVLSERFPELPRECGRKLDPGVIDNPEWFDWSVQHTTPDQIRIEKYLDRFDLRDCEILHVGVGNSSLAARLAGRCRAIVGTTISEGEVRIGRALGLGNYDVIVHNKFGEPLAGSTGRFDFIVDNNPTTFSCCLDHLMAMMSFYAGALAPGGQIVTDKVGLGWSLEPRPDVTPWNFSLKDFSLVAGLVGLRVERRGEFTIVASREKARSPSLGEEASWAWRKAVRAASRAVR